MNRITWLILFFVITAADLFLIATGDDDLRWFTKIFIIPLLAGFMISSLVSKKAFLYRGVVVALLFSWGGDLLLQAEPFDNLFFIFGLVSFLLAHICYIDYFNMVKQKEKIQTNWLLLLPVSVYYAGLIGLLFPHLGALKIPVIIYGAVISLMLGFALHLPAIKNKDAGLFIMTGAVLFVISDSLLAINKFYKPFVLAGITVMTTYIFAQLFIVAGIIRYIRKSSVEK